MKWFLMVLTNYVGFSGRAQRSEYWYYILFYVLIYIVLAILDMVVGKQIFTVAFALVLLIPSIAVGIRRLHDIGKSGWWLLIGLIPLVGFLILLYFAVLDSQPGANQYGPNPKGA